MTQTRSRRKRPESTSPDQASVRSSQKGGHQRSKTLRECLRQEEQPHSRSTHSASVSSLTSLIERDAPLQANSVLVLMYGPFQAEMVPQEGQGVASWLKDCVRQHGIPSLVRFDYRRRAQIYRRDQFQPWLEPFLTGLTG